jgi:hypothetical protein
VWQAQATSWEGKQNKGWSAHDEMRENTLTLPITGGLAKQSEEHKYAVITKSNVANSSSQRQQSRARPTTWTAVAPHCIGQRPLSGTAQHWTTSRVEARKKKVRRENVWREHESAHLELLDTSVADRHVVVSENLTVGWLHMWRFASK